MTETLTLSADAYLEHEMHTARAEHALHHEAADEWPVEPDCQPALDCAASAHGSSHQTLLARHDDGLVRIHISGQFAHVSAFGASVDAADRVLAWARAEIPRAEDRDPTVVPVTFWTLSPMGPESIRRNIDAPEWSEIQHNYPSADGLDDLVGSWRPGAGGQLILWHGEAGTGKTTALRALGREWRQWAELHYIVDPDKFFGESASYMMRVIMGGQDGKPSDDRPEPWRVLLLEDCAEMLAPDARCEVGQALSRLLNACDGLIGRGLRLLILITTNEPMEKIHPAISRPGRCAHRIEFGRFGAREAAAWLDRDDVPQSPTLADLYALRDGHRSESNGHRPVGFAVA